MNADQIRTAVKKYVPDILKKAVWKEEPGKSAVNPANAGTAGYASASGAASPFLTSKISPSADLKHGANGIPAGRVNQALLFLWRRIHVDS